MFRGGMEKSATAEACFRSKQAIKQAGREEWKEWGDSRRALNFSFSRTHHTVLQSVPLMPCFPSGCLEGFSLALSSLMT